MSLRAIKKRNEHFPSSTIQSSTTTAATLSSSIVSQRSTLFKKSQQQRKYCHNGNVTSTVLASNTLNSTHIPKHQSLLLGRKVHSNPELRSSSPNDWYDTTCLVRTKSENDVGIPIKNYKNTEGNFTNRGLFGAKSEVCLQTISTHNCVQPTTSKSNTSSTKPHNKMISGARSHRDLTQSSYNSSPYDNETTSARRRMSECSLNSSSAGYSQHTNSMTSSALTLASTAPPVDPNIILRVPIIGYEVMEERARFTVYKLRVENPHTNDCWLVLRRYTDFVRLNTKLKQTFPYVNLLLPRKKFFGDNFNSVFLDNRVQGLQMFVNSIMANEELRKCKLVREFFCLDEPPTYSESMEECRAIFEAQEETISHLKLQISNKNDFILNLQQKLRDELNEKEQLKHVLKNMKCVRCSGELSQMIN